MAFATANVCFGLIGFIARARGRERASRAMKRHIFAILIATATAVYAQDAVRSPSEAEPPAQGPVEARSPSPSELKRLPLEQLLDVEISSASRRPEPLSHASSAVDVITGDEIERAGAMNIPDALRLGTEMQV